MKKNQTLDKSKSYFYRIYKANAFIRWLCRICTPIVDPVRILTALPGYINYFLQWQLYSRMPGAEHLKISDAYPIFNEAVGMTGYDPHYIYQAVWAMNKIIEDKPVRHVDIASDHRFVTLLSTQIPTTFLDYRPLNVKLPGLTPVAGDILDLPFEANSILSLSCLHVVEHIGLGRYGEPIDPFGTKKACHELSRILAPGGSFYFSIPVGRERVCFNAQRIHAVETILEYFKPLQLIEFSVVDDDRCFIENAEIARFKNTDYACGMFWFRK
jgi:SAM-dependent methyltransferase